MRHDLLRNEMTAPAPQSAYQMIVDWASSRPLWQQDALRRIIDKGKLQERDISDLTLLCLKSNGEPDIDISAKVLEKDYQVTAPNSNACISLSSLSDIQNANRLASGQILQFSISGINIIYGHNGAGKSGYARILKRACRARFSTEILPNELVIGSAKGASAKISYTDENQITQNLTWNDSGTNHKALSTVSVFDREAGLVHLREESEVAYRPFGLDIPDELASACAAIKIKLNERQKNLDNTRDAEFIKPRFSSTSPTGKILSSLTEKTDLASLFLLSDLSSSDLQRLRLLTDDLARDPLKAAAEQMTWSKSLARFATDLAVTLNAYADDALDTWQEAARAAGTKRQTVSLAAEALFSSSALKGVGEQQWRNLWDAAKRFVAHSCDHASSFPPEVEGAPCPLCQQPLTRDALGRMSSFEAFITDDLELQAAQAEVERDRLYSATFSREVYLKDFPLCRQLRGDVPSLAKTILRSLAVARTRRSICLRSGSDYNRTALPDFPPSPIAELHALASAAETYSRELAAAADMEARQKLERERDDLRDRFILNDIKPKVEAEVARLASMARIDRCLSETNTKAVTTLGNSIADEIVTMQVRNRFQDELQKLSASRIQVDMIRSGGKFGSPQYKIRLTANEKAKPHFVLSEGEQTCVSLALFLTELATADHRSALIFDDPVSSLDHGWRQKVAERLVQEAKNRQIIVFTHDLVFLNDLQSLSERMSVVCNEISLSLSQKGAGIVTNGLPWIGQRVSHRLDTLEKEARAAKIIYDSQDDEAYADAVSRFYNRLRSTWERALEDVAFCNVIQRHRDYINAKELRKVAELDPSDVTAWQVGFKICCDITDAHDPARGRNAPAPPPGDMLKHVQFLASWVQALRDRHKLVG